MGRGWGEPKRPEGPGEQTALLRVNPSESDEVGAAFTAGPNRWSAGTKPGWVLWESAGAEKAARKSRLTAAKEQSSEGRNPGALGAEKSPQGHGWLTPPRG
jgi:hypothetical protein